MIALVTSSGIRILAADEGSETESTATTETPKKEPNPILPVGKEIIWGVGSFLVLFVLMRFIAFPKVKTGMEARAAKIRTDLEGADRAKASIVAEREAYAAKIASARSEASRIVDEARREVEGIRTERIAALNAELAEVRSQATAEIEASKATALGQLEGVVTDLAAGAAQLVVQRPVDRAAASPIVAAYMSEAGAK